MRYLWWLVGVVAVLCVALLSSTLVFLAAAPASIARAEPLTTVPTPARTLFLPLLTANTTAAISSTLCATIPGPSFGSLPILHPSITPAESNPDINLAMRGYAPTATYRGLVDYGNAADNKAPQLPGLYTDLRVPAFTSTYEAYDWNWTCNCRGGLITDWPATTLGMAVTPAELIHLPASAVANPIAPGYQALVLYATSQRITLKYTLDDNVVSGYTLHLENVCVDPILVALYQTLNSAGRHSLPALAAGQAFAHPNGPELVAAVRDTGAFMDPRSRRDWWQGH